jgi:hypothetical protein
MDSAISDKTKVLRGRYGEERVVVGTKGEGIGVERRCLEGVWHRDWSEIIGIGMCR